MNDELPSEERLSRIERGVQQRIDARRALRRGMVRGVTGVAVAAVILGGGFALLRTQGTASSTSAGGSAASAPSFGPAASAGAVAVDCHGTRALTVQADGAGLPTSALQACTRAERAGATADEGTTSGSKASATSATTLCRTKAGALHVYPGGPSACAVHGMTAYPG